jgi:AcrR family transcriptional regulator
VIGGAPRRADAVRNREAVVRAADEVFAEKGLEASIPDIAARAGVGKATVYRSFPTKEHLVAAVACERVNWITAQALAALDDDDPLAAFERVVLTVAERQSTDRSVAGSMAAKINLPDLDAARDAAWTAIDALMDRAQRAGALRDDVGSDDFNVLFTGVARILRDRDEHDPEVWRRYGELIIDALRARPSPRARGRASGTARAGGARRSAPGETRRP